MKRNQATNNPSWRGLCGACGPTALGLLAVCALALPTQAQWNSLRANNRSTPAQRAAPRAAAPAVRGREAERHAAPETGRFQAPERHEEIEHGRETRTGRESFEHGRAVNRHWDFDEDRRRAYPWFGINPGALIRVLPPGFSQIYVGGNPYYYDEGIYYQQAPSGYVAVTPPIGAIVAALPPGAEAIQVGPTVYYYAGGAFYVQQPQGYLVVTPPPGITVTALPPGAVQANINGMLYYQADGAYFQPMIQGGITVYMTVQP